MREVSRYATSATLRWVGAGIGRELTDAAAAHASLESQAELVWLFPSIAVVERRQSYPN